jgi:glycosyltransferase involved in cell wall biosynthesis
MVENDRIGGGGVSSLRDDATDQTALPARSPRVCVGVPVYNGAKFLTATLDSLLAQTYRDFEIVICDNASTDATESICREYARRDPRVRYVRHRRNIGIAPNFNAAFEQCRSELFKWCAADDLAEPEFLEKCVALLDADPSAVAAYPSTAEIGPDGEHLFDHDELNLSQRSAAARLATLVFTNHRKHRAPELWAVYRADVLRQWRPLKGSYPSADRVVLARVVLRGAMLRVPDRLFLNRAHGGRSQNKLERAAARPHSLIARLIGSGPIPAYDWWDPRTKGKIVFPEWKWLGEYWRAAIEADLPILERFKCYAVLAALSVFFSFRLTRDVLIGMEQAARMPADPKPASRSLSPSSPSAQPAPAR